MHHLTNVPQDGREELKIFGLCQVEEGPRTQQNHCDGLRGGREGGRGGQREETPERGGEEGRPERRGKAKEREGRKRSDTFY